LAKRAIAKIQRFAKAGNDFRFRQFPLKRRRFFFVHAHGSLFEQETGLSQRFAGSERYGGSPRSRAREGRRPAAIQKHGNTLRRASGSVSRRLASGRREVSTGKLEQVVRRQTDASLPRNCQRA